MITRCVTITATRCYLGQVVVEVPSFCRDDRLGGIIRAGGATARLLAARMVFPPISGTGLATAYVRAAKELVPADLPLSDLRNALLQDGFVF